MPTDGGAPDLLEATIPELHGAFTDGTRSAAELVDYYVDRIDSHDEDLNALLTVNPVARERAAALDRRRASGEPMGPLHGIPVVLKDNHDTADLPTTLGSAPLAGAVPERDAFVVRQLRDAGAVVLAKANLQELSFGVDTISSLGGATANPYVLDRRPGGSSGGTATAIAANLGVVGTGTDTCSSVRSPPAFTNLVGIRPTRGLVSRTGIGPLSATQDIPGPIARTVADAATLLDVMTGFDVDDPITAHGIDQRPTNGYVAHVDSRGLEGARIGVLRPCFGLQDETAADPAAAAAVTDLIDDAVREMASAGATVVDPAACPDLDRVRSARVIQYEFKRDFDRYLANRDEVPLDSLSELLATGEVATPIADRIREQGILDVDSGEVGTNRDYLRRLRRRDGLRTELSAQLLDAELDALVYPPSTIPPVVRPDHQPFSEMQCELSAHTGCPAIVVPAGFTDAGAPVGVEFLGRPFTEARLIAVAAGFEAATAHRRPPAAFS